MFIIALAQTSAAPSGADLYLTYIIYILFIASFAFAFLPGLNQRAQMWFLLRDVESRLVVLEKYAKDARENTEKLLKEKGVSDPKPLTERLAELFTIEPVGVEPTDIINRMRLLYRTTEDKIVDLIQRSIPNVDTITRSKIEMSAEVTNALNMFYKVVRHYMLTAKKLNNYLLLYQLQMIVPILVKQAEAYLKAQKVFEKGIPVGDAIGPLVASRLLMNADNKRTVSKDTIAGDVMFEGRKLIVVKAEGPKATVGTPGEAVAKVIEEQEGKVKRIVTVDAMLRLEGEETGTVAEGTGVAMGDPGPEKIEIERVAAKYTIPIDAVVIKMGLDEAITAMRKEVYNAAEKALDLVREIIKERTNEGDTVVLVGVGNTGGVAQ
ncbi:hypothetical protein HS7_05920 [Sulfolobales archaeon HS-7]|nr:hypothetical protein HS7_05920 [Sulfolobales archaeon HS-7]